MEIGKRCKSTGFKIGDKVVFGTNCSCGLCEQCRSNKQNNCINFNHSVKNEALQYHGMGGFSEFIFAYPSELYKYSNVSPILATFTEPISCVIQSIDKANIMFGENVLVVGCGVMGQLHIELAQKKGASIIASDSIDDRLKLAEKHGAKLVVDVNNENLNEKVMKQTNGLGVDVVFLTVPNASLVPELMELLNNNGRLILYSSFGSENMTNIDVNKMHMKGLEIRGTANSNQFDFSRATKLISQSQVNLQEYVSNVFSFEDTEKAMLYAIENPSYRVIIDFNV